MTDFADRLPPQDVLPFPPTPTASIAGRTMQESVYGHRETPRRLPDDAPNILIVLIDDVGPGLPDTFGGMKLLASHLGGTRNPMAVRWPATITPDGTPRRQFHHCNDITPTVYEILGITPPRVVNGVPQDPIDGTSLAYTFGDAEAEGRLHTQYFEIMGSRSIYHDGWLASTFGPRAPWVPGAPPGIATWTPDQDVWELYDLDEDWSQANDLAGELPDKLAQMKETFSIEAARNSVYPVGGGLWIVALHPELRVSTPYREWTFTSDITRMPEFCAPALGNRDNVVTIKADVPEDVSGVLYALRSGSGGLTLYSDNGVPTSAPLLFTANDCLDIGTCLGGPVSLDCYDRAPFPFQDDIETVHVGYAT